MNPKILLFIVLFLLANVKILAQEVTELKADGPGNTYELLSNVLGGTPYEIPDCDHEENFQHIDEAYNATLDRYVFRFYIHKDIDTDRCGTNTDRQRNEIKAYSPSPAKLKGTLGETVIYEWFFKIDENFQPSSRFTHLFQLKASGGDDDANPVFTITPRETNRLELIHGSGNDNYSVIESTELDKIKGKWAKVTCETTYLEDNGDFSITISLLDGTEVISYAGQLDMWRTGADFVRPKWGIYRSLGDKESLRDEVVLFADFKITEKETCPIWYEDADNDGKGDPNNVIVSCEQPEGYVANNDDLECRTYYEDKDGDFLGDPNSPLYSCDQPEGYVANDVDEDCGQWYQDSDNDGLGNPAESTYACAQPEGYVANDDDDNDNLPVAIDDVNDNKVYLYPTITRGSIQIKGINNPDYQVRDMTGRLLLKGNGNVVNVKRLREGVYLLFLPEKKMKFIVKY